MGEMGWDWAPELLPQFLSLHKEPLFDIHFWKNEFGIG